MSPWSRQPQGCPTLAECSQQQDLVPQHLPWPVGVTGWWALGNVSLDTPARGSCSWLAGTQAMAFPSCMAARVTFLG